MPSQISPLTKKNTKPAAIRRRNRDGWTGQRDIVPNISGLDDLPPFGLVGLNVFEEESSMRHQITAILFSLLALSGAHGQATFGTASDPITGAMLERWFSELDLSQPQRQAVDQLHAGYLEEFADVRGDEIEDVAGKGGIFGAIFGGGDVNAVATGAAGGDIAGTLAAGAAAAVMASSAR